MPTPTLPLTDTPSMFAQELTPAATIVASAKRAVSAVDLFMGGPRR
jgi:hypothetical protein